MTSSKGHFNLSTYNETINDLSQQIPLELFANRFAHIKISDDTKYKELEMEGFFKSKNFSIRKSYANWSHFSETHMTGYISDLCKMFADDEVLKTPYTLISEDDFLIRTESKDLLYYIHEAVKTLEDNHDIVQIRIPRFNNERARIDGLFLKHKIQAKTLDFNQNLFLANDWSNNVYISRTRDLSIAMLLLKRNPTVFGQHAEHSVSAVMRYLSESEVPLGIFYPDKIRCYHIGAEPQNRDIIGQELNSN
jgi:hypothetical protein